MQVRIVRLPQYVDVEMAGHVQMHVILEAIGKVGATTRAYGDGRALLDLLQLEGDVPLAAQVQIGEQVASCLGHLGRVACVAPAGKVTEGAEQAARLQGTLMKVFESKDMAIAWLRDTEPSGAGPAKPVPMDAVRTAIWEALRHLFPGNARAIQFPNGTLAISWSVANQPGAVYEMATPITIRLEPELVEQMRLANAEQRKRIAAHQEAAFRAGLVGYDPLTSVPKARVIVLG
jgi:hypothetical protein